ncbi:MAG: serine dehydratase beta chain, partial [Myroides sp.]
MECISVFDMLKIGVGPSSSHTLGPWRAAERFIAELKELNIFDKTERVTVDLYGSLSLTGIGHATDLAVMLGLSGADPEYVPVDDISGIIDQIKQTNILKLGNAVHIQFNPSENIVFNKNFLPFHANGLTFTAFYQGGEYVSTFYSIGGGFVVKEESAENSEKDEIKA